MRRILVVGSPGAGKTVVATRLAAGLGLPLVHLDREFHLPGWAEPPLEQWVARVEELIAAEEWVIDGNYGSTMELRLSRADTAVFLDLPTLTCVIGVLGRVRRWRGRSRPDMADGCPEHFNLEFLRYTLRFRRDTRPRVVERLARFDGDVIVLRSRRAVRRYLVSPPPGRS